MVIERKFRVRGQPWRDGSRPVVGVAMRQGYLASTPAAVVRVRVTETGAWLTVKGPTRGISRDEFEYPIPLAEGKALLELCGERVIEKTRYALEEQGARFEVDVFEGRNAGLVVAEIELRDPEQVFPRPSWLGEEVSEDARYRNSELSVHPYSEWSEESSVRSGTEASSSS